MIKPRLSATRATTQSFIRFCTFLGLSFWLVTSGHAEGVFLEYPRQVFPDCAIVWRVAQQEPDYVQCLDSDGIVSESVDRGVRVGLVSSERLRQSPVFEEPQFVETVPAPLVGLIDELTRCQENSGCGAVFEDERVSLLTSIDPSNGVWVWKDPSGFTYEPARPVAYFFELGNNIVVFHGIGKSPWETGKFNVFRFFVVGKDQKP